MPQDRQLTPLGIEMERRRLDSGLTVTAYISAHGISRNSWYRLAYGSTQTPAPSTVRDLAEAIDLDPATALRLAGLGEAAKLTPLGELMEKARRAAGMKTAPLCRARGINRTTWYALAYEAKHPRPDMVLKVADKLRIDRAQALTATGHDPALAGPPVSQTPADRDGATQPAA